MLIIFALCSLRLLSCSTRLRDAGRSTLLSALSLYLSSFRFEISTQFSESFSGINGKSAIRVLHKKTLIKFLGFFHIIELVLIQLGEEIHRIISPDFFWIFINDFEV